MGKHIRHNWVNVFTVVTPLQMKSAVTYMYEGCPSKSWNFAIIRDCVPVKTSDTLIG